LKMASEPQLHSVRHDHHQEPNRGAIMIPKKLQAYGEEIAALLLIDEDLERRFNALHRLENELREYGCTPPRPDLSGQLRAAWSHHRGEGFWER
jgi:hypothetical protein